MPATYWKSLDGLRAIAVLLVIIAHAETKFLRSGGVGVDIFFVLSGFLITGILSREMQRHGSVNLRNFYARRFLRLAPCLVLTCALFALFTLALEGRFPGAELAVALTYTANWARALFDYDMGALGHCWSLAIEEQYYLIWPFIIVLLERTVKTPRAKFQALLLLAIGLALYRASMVGIYSSERIYFALDTHMDGLVLGSAISYLVPRSGEAPLFSKTLFARFVGFALAPMAFGGLLLLVVYMTWRDPGMGSFGFLVAAVCSAFIIVDLACNPRSLAQWPLSLPPVIYIGKISYGIYLLHMPIYHALQTALPELPAKLMVPLEISASLAAAALSFHLVETPFLRLKKRFESRKTPAVVSPTTTATVPTLSATPEGGA